MFDEVITGFRLGLAGAQGMYGITPDLSMFGKVVGGGFPLAALGGRADVMDELAPLGPVYQAGTLSGNPVATAAGLAVLSLLDDDTYVDLTRRVTRFTDGLRGAFASADTKAQVVQVGTLSGLFFADAPVNDYADAQAADHARYARFFHGMLERGVFLPPSGYETMFVSLAHTDAELDSIVDAASEAATATRNRPRQIHCRVAFAQRKWRGNESRERALGLGVFVLAEAAAADVVHEEHGAAADHDHHREEHEREPTGAVALPARVDELLRAGGCREEHQCGDRAQGERDDEAQTSQHAHTFAGTGVGRFWASCSLLLLRLDLVLVLLAPVEHQQPEHEQDRRHDEGDERRHSQRPEVSGEHDEPGDAVGVALGRDRREHGRPVGRCRRDLTELGDRVERIVGELQLPELRVAATDLERVEDLVLRDVAERRRSRTGCRRGRAARSGVSSLGTRTASTAAFTFAASVGSTRFAGFWMPWTASILESSGLWTTSCTSHCGIRPLIVLSGDEVVHQSRLRITMKPMSPVKATRNPRRAPRLVPRST